MPIEVPWKPNGKRAFVARHTSLYLYVKSGNYVFKSSRDVCICLKILSIVFHIYI